MNNYQPYYTYYNPNMYQNAYMQQPTQQIQQQPQPTQQLYDFQGNYVKSYDEVKNSPYTDKPTVYLDTEHDKIYIKSITDKGVPETNVFSIVTSEKTETKEQNKEPTFKEELEKLKAEYDKKISSLENQFKELKGTKGGK